MASRTAPSVPLLLLAALTVAPASAQQPDSAPPGASGDSELVFEREVFRYPTFQRRSPFRPLVGDQGGPRFEQIALRGIIYDPVDPRESIALLSLRGQAAQQLEAQVQQRIQQQEMGTAPVADTIYIPDPARRMRVGESWGNTRIVQIHRDHVVVAVTEFGVTDQRVLTMPTRRQGGL